MGLLFIDSVLLLQCSEPNGIVDVETLGSATATVYPAPEDDEEVQNQR